MIALFALAPALIDLRWFGLVLVPLLIALGVLLGLVLWFDPSFDRQRLWRTRGLKRELPRILSIWTAAAILMTAFLFWYAPDRLFSFIRHNPRVWVVVMIAYPALSAFMQGVVFRCFFFHRYAAILPKQWMPIGAAALAFGWAHIVLENWIAVGFCCVGGTLFSITYLRTQSNLIATLEQALYGNFIWTIGLGAWFYAGNISP